MAAGEDNPDIGDNSMEASNTTPRPSEQDRTTASRDARSTAVDTRNNETKGFYAKNHSSIEQRFKCNLCTLILREPVQLGDCGHRYCTPCAESLIRNGVIECNACHKKTIPSRLFPDWGFRIDMDTLTIACALCEWKGTFKDYNEHLTKDHRHQSYETCIQDMETGEAVNVLAGAVKSLNDDITSVNQQLNNLTTKVVEMATDMNTVKKDINTQSTTINAFGTNQSVIETDIACLQTDSKDSKNISYDGTLTWKIENVAQKMADAQSERQTSIYSPIFYSSPIGYKMRARLYLHGDGNARRTHMSLFFVLMRGDYDAILKFPFPYKVTFCLFDQSGNQRHIIDSFRPDTKSNSFQRPKSEMNIASGIPKFFPLPMIQQDGNSYIVDDTMFIKIMVQFDDEMPKTMLPYALTLNQGLPERVQDNMIRREIEKRVRQTSGGDTTAFGTNAHQQ